MQVTGTALPGLVSHRVLQGLVKIGNQVIDMLDADRYPC
jgi:hypothetical protein